MSARRAAKSDRVDDALVRSPSATQSSSPPTCHRHRRCPSVSGDAPARPTRVHPFQGRHPTPDLGPRRCPQNTGTDRPRAPKPGTGVARRSPGRTGRVRRRPALASPLFLLDGADRGGSAAPGTHRCEPSHPLRGGALFINQRLFQRGGWLPRVPAVPVPSARSRVGGRGRPRR